MKKQNLKPIHRRDHLPGLGLGRSDMITSAPKAKPDFASQKKVRAFTLVELLMVIAMIGVLAGILLPVLGKAADRAKRIQCINAERQLVLAWTMYAFDNNDKLAANGKPMAPEVYPKWVNGAFVNPSDATNEVNITGQSLFGNYIHNSQTYVCPGDPSSVNYSGFLYARVRSYSMNNYLGWEGIEDDRLPLQGWRVARKSTDINNPSPSDTFVFQDVNNKSICWPYFGVYMDQDAFFNFPSSVHSKGGVVSFADGSVRAHRWLDTRTIQAQSPDYHNHYDPSEGNVDVGWLQNHATSPQ
jgi:prepilin-type N-terminal cleavage/methylation domain-containing protein/prepilin-type processing-associated H-X9-DG protein